MDKELVADNIKIRPITKADTSLIVSWRNNPSVREHFIFQEIFTDEMHDKWFETQICTGKVAQFIIETIDKAFPIGSVYLRDIDENYRKAEYGIFLSDISVMGKGYGPIATKLILEYAFDQLHLNKVFLRVFSENKRAIKSYLKSGFEVEGIFKEDVRIANDYKDVTFMAIFKSRAHH